MRPVLLDPRNGPLFDLPPPSAPARVYLIASTPRTGSTLLCRSLWDTGLVGAPKEYLNPMQIRDWEVRMGSRRSRWAHRALRGPLLAAVRARRWPQDRVAAHLQRVRARRTGPTGWFGLKIHYHHLIHWLPDPEALLGPEIHWIRIIREDEVAQAVSWYRALQTGKWASHQRPWMPPIYSQNQIARRLQLLRAHRAGWDRWFAARGIAPLTVRYEDLASDLNNEIQRVLSFLGVDAAPSILAPMTRQADPISARWVARFRSGQGMGSG